MSHHEVEAESINLKPSVNIEITLIELGHALYTALMRSERTDELGILLESIGEYESLASQYGDQTGRVPESLGVDLNEAALLKLTALSKKTESEWRVYAAQFRESLAQVAKELDIDYPNF